MLQGDREMKPCPFCGSSEVEQRETVCDAVVACCNCGSRTGLVFLGPSEAVNAAKMREQRDLWNTRPASSPDEMERVVVTDEMIEAGCRADYADWPMKAFSPALQEATGLAYNEAIPYDRAIELGMNGSGTRRMLRSAFPAMFAAMSKPVLSKELREAVEQTCPNCGPGHPDCMGEIG